MEPLNLRAGPLPKGFEPSGLYWEPYVEPLWNLEPLKCGTFMWNLYGMWNFSGAGIHLRVEPLCKTCAFLRTFKSGTFMWNVGEPGARFRAAATNFPPEFLPAHELVKMCVFALCFYTFGC